MVAVLHRILALKILVYALRRLAVSMIAPTLWLKIIPAQLDRNRSYMGIEYVHHTTSHSCDYMCYVRHIYVGTLRDAAKITCDYLY